jgi:hypothetical protein
MGSSGGSVLASTTVFTGLSSQNGTEGLVQQVAPVTQTFTKMYCFGPKGTAGTSDVFTLRVNGANTTAVCTVPTGGTSVVTVTGLNVTVNAGDLIAVRVATGNLAGGVTWGLAP